MAKRNSTLLLVFSAPLFLSGCAINIPLGTETHRVTVSAPEAAFQVVNAVDFADTVSGARQPCKYSEGGWPTREIIGAHPSPRSVELYWAGYSALHLLASSWLDREVDATDALGWKVARIVFQVGSIASAANAVQNNWHMGVRPFQGHGIC